MEFMTALRGGASFDEHKPSLFELLSEQQLNALLPPTLRYLLTVATHRHPRYLLRLLNSFDELYALLALLVEAHYLRTRAGTFTEHFYGLKRERVVTVGDIPRASRAAPGAARQALRLRRGDVLRNLAVVVALPWLKRRLDEAHEVDAPRALMGAAYNNLPAEPTLRDRVRHAFRWFLRRVYPGVNAAYGLCMLAFNLAYLFDNSRYHSPFLWLIGTRVRRMGGADYRALEEEMAGKGAAGAGSAPGWRTLLTSPREMGGRALGALSVVLPTSIFALKFLEWWYASDFAKQLSRKAAETLELPPPVVAGMLADGAQDGKGLKGILKKQQREREEREEREQRDEQRKKKYGNSEEAEDQDQGQDQDEAAAAAARLQAQVDDAPIAQPSLLPILTVPAPAAEDSGLCPICEGEIATATACQTGWVYCYGCIHRWVEGGHARQEEFMADKAGRWESGEGRCAVTGRRVLGGTEGLRRIMV